MRPDFGPHFLIATEAEAAAGAQQVELDNVDGFEVWNDGTHGMCLEQLAQLHCLLLGRETDLSVLDAYKQVSAGDEMHGPWLVCLPDEFVSALASLNAEQLASIGEKWWEASSEFEYRQTPREWVQRLAIRLVALARRAVHQNKSMYLEPPSC